jgi:hypothetical protein
MFTKLLPNNNHLPGSAILLFRSHVTIYVYIYLKHVAIQTPDLFPHSICIQETCAPRTTYQSGEEFCKKQKNNLDKIKHFHAQWYAGC